jgi:hypothetical protein
MLWTLSDFEQNRVQLLEQISVCSSHRYIKTHTRRRERGTPILLIRLHIDARKPEVRRIQPFIKYALSAPFVWQATVRISNDRLFESDGTGEGPYYEIVT